MKLPFILALAAIILVSGCISSPYLPKEHIKLIPDTAEPLDRYDLYRVADVLKYKAELLGSNASFIPALTSRPYIAAVGLGNDSGLLEEIISPWEFKGVLTVPVALEDGKGALRIGDKAYQITDDRISAEGSEYDVSSEFQIEGIWFTLKEKTDSKAVFYAMIYTNDDIVEVRTGPQHSNIVPTDTGYRFYFVIETSPESGKRFADLTMNIPEAIPKIKEDMETWLDSSMLLYLNRKLISDLRISGNLAGQNVMTPAIQGTRETRYEASDELNRLASVIAGGKFPFSFIVEE